MVDLVYSSAIYSTKAVPNMRRNDNAFFFSRLLAVAPFLLFLGHSAAAAPAVVAPVGVVVIAQGAQISQVAAVNGTSLYPGDTLSTDATGSLRVRFGTSQLMLGPATEVKIAQNEHVIAAILQRGIVRFSMANNAIELEALDHVAVHTHGDAASGEFVLAGPNEFQIACTHGALIVDIDGAQRVVAESSSFDVTLKDAPDYEDNAKHPGRRKKLGLWVAISAILITTGVMLYLSTLSSSRF
jgi:hypothetical protein